MEIIIGIFNVSFWGEFLEIVGFFELEIVEIEVDSVFVFFDFNVFCWLKNFFFGLCIEIE